MFAVSGIAVTLFFGGWHLGIPVLEWAGLTHDTWLGTVLIGVIGLKVFLLKSSFLVFVQMWVRWTLPRLRVDQVMTTCLKYLLPISCFLLVAICAWPLLIYQLSKSVHGAGRTVLFGPALGDLRTAHVLPVSKTTVAAARDAGVRRERMRAEALGEEGQR